MDPYLQISRTAARALEDFSDQFRGALALGSFDAWAESIGLVNTSDAIKTTYPLPVDAAGYRELKGDIKFRTIYNRALSMKTKTWTDGVEALVDEIAAPDFSDWAGQPAHMAYEWQRHPNVIVADMLALSSFNGPLLDLYRDPDSEAVSTRRLFASDHPYHILDEALGSFDNTTTTTVSAILDGSFFESCNTYFRSLKGANGRPLGIRYTNNLVPAARESTFKEALEQDTLVRAVTNLAGTENVAATVKRNLYQGLGYQVSDELTSDDYFYCLGVGAPGMVPWVIQKGPTPEEIVHDMSSHKYKTERKVAVAYVGRMNVGAALPHCIRRVQITG